MTKELLEVYCDICMQRFNTENVWDAVEYNNLIVCNECFDAEYTGGEFNRIEFNEN